VARDGAKARASRSEPLRGAGEHELASHGSGEFILPQRTQNSQKGGVGRAMKAGAAGFRRLILT
jgi:hypothetical protein